MRKRDRKLVEGKRERERKVEVFVCDARASREIFGKNRKRRNEKFRIQHKENL